tara:strand:+ start:1697 stop:1975 length:279 start_codon:yes stop_codon:yes gene_type:complete
MFVEDILQVKDQLLNPKRSDEFIVPLNVEGWRYFKVKVGNKYCFLTPLAGGNRTRKKLSFFKQELKETYWSAAMWHSGRQGKRPRNWKNSYA